MTNSIQQKLIRRLKIIEGQVRGLQGMVENNAYCVDVITQASALKKAISSVEDAVLENHLATHVVEQIKGGQHTKAINEVMKVYKLSKKDK
jgi:DNA-binding FrmR family transcriptional regulator